jgi:O-6-methylguanine DNA methyltransferase
MPKNLKPKSFTDLVLDVVRNIKPGETLSYTEVAKQAHRPNAARAVGTIMAKNFRPDVPCHRVVRKNVTPGSYNRGGEEAKRAILLNESKSN